MSGSHQQDQIAPAAGGEAARDSPPSDSHRSSSGGVPAIPPAAAVEVNADRVDRPADLPDFRILAKIGQGGFGSVWIAQHRHTGDAVAIKFIPPKNREIELSGLQHLRQRVRDGQDHLVWTEYIGESDGFVYCVMDLADPVVEGPLFADRYEALTLLKYMKQKGRLDVLEATAVTLAIARGLSFLQGAGLRHGDIKPANILRVRGKWKLADYGMMGGLDVRARGGTRSYLPPEGPHGDRADQFALGIVLHELVFGHRPSDSSRETWPESRISTGLRRIQQRLTDPDQSRRYPSAGELVKELETLTSTAGPAAAGATGACPGCGESIFGSEEACGSCGGELWRQCPICQHRGSIVQRYCTQCRGPVHGVFSMRKELNEADSLLCDGRHRDCLQRIEGPLQDLLLEVARDLARLRGGELSRQRRVEGIESEFRTRLEKMRDRCRMLEIVDAQIASAHERGNVIDLRDGIARALEIVPGARTYEALRADLPALEARSRWTSVLARLGNPHQSPEALDSGALDRAIGTLRQHIPEHPTVKEEAKRTLAALQDERRRRIRDRCRTAAAWHRKKGRRLEALRWLRRAESRHAADRSMLSEIAGLSTELAPVAASMKATATAQLQQAGDHRSLRRLESDLRAIEGAGAPVIARLQEEWPRRRRIDLLRRISERALRRIGEGDFLGTDPLLALAFRIADREPAVRERVIDLDNSIAARIRTARSLVESADIAEASGRVEQALELLEKAESISPACEDLAVRLVRIRAAASAVPARRRRRRLVVAAAVFTVAVAAVIVAHHAWHLVPLHDLASRLESPSRGVSAEARLQAAAALGEPNGWSGLLLTDLGLNEEIRTQWMLGWERDHGTQDALTQEAAFAAADELAVWHRVNSDSVDGARGPVGQWIESATRRLIERLSTAAATRNAKAQSWRSGVTVAVRSGSGISAFLAAASPAIELELTAAASSVPSASVIDSWLGLATDLESHSASRSLGERLRAAVDGWCEDSIESIRAEFDELVDRALALGPRAVDPGGSAEILEPWAGCGERRKEVIEAFDGFREQLDWIVVSISLDGAEPKVLGERSPNEADSLDRLELVPIVISTTSGSEFILAATAPMSVEVATRLLGAPAPNQWRGKWVPAIDEAEAACRRVPSFEYLGTSWEPAIPDFDRWIALRDLQRRGDPAQSDLLGALQYDEKLEEWLAPVGPSPRSINPQDSRLRVSAPDGMGTTGLRLIFTPVSPSRGGGGPAQGHRANSLQGPLDSVPTEPPT